MQEPNINPMSAAALTDSDRDRSFSGTSGLSINGDDVSAQRDCAMKFRTFGEFAELGPVARQRYQKIIPPGNQDRLDHDPTPSFFSTQAC